MSQTIKRRETAYHGSRDRKARFIREQRKHARLDRFMRGSIGSFSRTLAENENPWDDIGTIASTEDFQGCGIACSVYSIKRIKRERLLPKQAEDGEIAEVDFYDHELVADYLGISLELAKAFESTFESLYDGDESKFAIEFAMALKPGSQPRFDASDLLAFNRLYDGDRKREHLLNLLRNSKPVVEAR